MKEGRYTNLDGTTPDKGLGAIFKWQVADRLSGKRPKGPPAAATPTRPNDGAALLPLTPHLTWIGHASFVQRLGGKLLVTDPVWGNVPGGIKRLAPPGVALRALPPVDVVSISHSHYDHLDLPTLRALADGPAKNATFLVPENVGEVLSSAGIPNVVELPWWGAHTVGELRCTLVPAQHWSMRVPWDRNRRLWGGFVYEGLDAAGGTSWHTGDTAFSEQVFTAIGERFPEHRLGHAAHRRVRPRVVHAAAAHEPGGGDPRLGARAREGPGGDALGHLQAHRRTERRAAAPRARGVGHARARSGAVVGARRGRDARAAGVRRLISRWIRDSSGYFL